MGTHSKEYERLALGMSALGIAVVPAAVNLLLEYSALLRQWNRTYNLVSAAGLADLIGRHLLDSLSILAGIT